MATANEELKSLLEDQPEDSSSEEFVRELDFRVMLRRGLADSDAGRTISNDEMDQRIRPSKRNVRILIYGHYRIAYLMKPSSDVDILGVFHGSLDISRYSL